MQDRWDRLRAKAEEYGSIPFWSWNDRLEEGELRRQIGQMQKMGMHGFFMHARGGLETEYLSEDWFDAVRVCVDEAKKRGMEAWAYDENGWPSGFAGGKLLTDKKNFALGLLWEYVTDFPADEDTVAVYTKKSDGGFTHVKEPCGAHEYLRIYRQYDRSYVDTLDASITREFLRLTHEEYEKRLGEDFGGVMPGFFTDEPQYFRYGTTYSNTLPQTFRDTYGYEVFSALPALFFDFPGAPKLRFDYYKHLHEQFINNWVRIVYEWCHDHGVRLTGHAIEETSLGWQMECCGGVMPFYEYEDIPGIDRLGRFVGEDIAPKQLGSVCAQLEKKKALTETFACCGWDVSPMELRRIADLQYAGGTNLMCEHLYPYSERGQRKRDYPLHYSEHNPWQSEFGAFVRHYNNLGAILSEGRDYAPVLVIHPMHGAYMEYKKGTDSLAEIDGQLKKLSDFLGQHQIPYHYGDENLMKKYAAVEGRRLRVGACLYDCVIVPFTYSLDHETCALLQDYLAAGGRVWLWDKAPSCVDGEAADMSWLCSNMSLDDVLSYRDAVITAQNACTGDLRCRTRVLKDGSRFVFVTNITEHSLRDVRIIFPGAQRICEVSIDTLERRPVFGTRSEGGVEITADFDDSAAVYWIDGDEDLLVPGQPARVTEYIPVPRTMTFTQKPLNMITLDSAELARGDAPFDAPLSIYGIRDNLLREHYEGAIRLRWSFTVRDLPEKLCLVLEPMGQTQVTVNGREVVPTGDWWFDRSFLCYDIADAAKAGKNEIEVSLEHRQRPEVYDVLYGGVSESLRNCLDFDTEIECAYLTGSFCVESESPFVPDKRCSECCDGPFVLTAQKDTLDVTDAVRDGYPFYGGHLELSFNYEWKPGKPTVLGLGGRFATCAVRVNGEKAGTMLLSRTLELSSLLHDGTNRIELDVANAMRNLCGPHHRPDPEPYGVGPQTFSFEKEWNGRECRSYLDRYAFVRFGFEGM